MIDYSNIKFPIYSNKYGQSDYLALIETLTHEVSKILSARRQDKDTLMGRIALPLIVFYSEWYRRDYVGGKGSQQWEEPLISKGICTKDEFRLIRALLMQKVRERYDSLASRFDLLDTNGQLLRSVLCQGGLPVEYIINGRENNSFFTLLHWIVSESLNNELPPVSRVKAKTEQMGMSPTLTGIDTCNATLRLAESITSESEVPFNVSDHTLKELEDKLKKDRDRVKQLGLNKPLFFKNYFIEHVSDDNYVLRYTVKLEESFSVERAYRLGLPHDIQRFFVSHRGELIGKYIRMSDGLFHCREFKGHPHFLQDLDGDDNCNVVDIKTEISTIDCDLASRFSFTGNNILLTEWDNNIWKVKNRFKDEGSFYVWIPGKFTVCCEEGLKTECSLCGIKYYRVLVNQLHPAKLYSPEGRQLDLNGLFTTDYTVTFHGLDASWLLDANMYVISDLPDDYNIQVYDNINQRRERKYTVTYRAKNDTEYHSISSALPEGIIFIRVDVGYQQFEKRFFYAKGLNCELDNHNHTIQWSYDGICDISSNSTDVIKGDKQRAFSLKNEATVRTIGFDIRVNNDIVRIDVPAPTNNIRVLDVDGSLLRSGQSICIQNLHYYTVYSSGKRETRISIKPHSGDWKGSPVNLSRLLPFRSSLSDFKRDIETIYYAETLSPLNTTHDFVELSFPDSGLVLKCVFYNRLAEPNKEDRELSIIDDGYREDESVSCLYYVPLDCDVDDISVREWNRSESNKYVFPNSSTNLMVIPLLDGSINLVRPTLLTLFPRETNWRDEILSSNSPQDKVWAKLHKYYEVCRQSSIPFDVFKCFQALCGKYVIDFCGNKPEVCPQEHYQTFVSRFALTMLCIYNEPVDDFMLRFARSFNFMWHWISFKTWEEALEWGAFEPLETFEKLNQLVSDELCLPITNHPIICTCYSDLSDEEISIDHMTFGEMVNQSYEHKCSSFNDFIAHVRPLTGNVKPIHGPGLNLNGNTDIIRSINNIINKGERQLFKSAYIAASLFLGRYQSQFRNPKAILYAQMNTSVYSVIFTNILRYI